MDKAKVWEKFLEQINLKVSAVSFNTWFKDLKLLTINEKDIVVIVPYLVHKNHIINNYMDIIEEIFLEITGSPHNIIICLEGEYQEQVIPKQVINNPSAVINESVREK